ncbi:MAG: MOSC N-terminal beta barrel domain-containing protein [Elusimicrobia bacterium]|nr:MOSC N-terminal beta barrel domain-containing protein [Elusimicrobiota bacterium]
MAVVSRLFRYPVKSLSGLEESALELTARGPRFDREWMLVDGQGLFLSQRKLPRMCLVKTALSPDALTLSAPGLSPLSVLFERAGRARVEATVWDDACRALDEGDAAAAWLSGFLGEPCRLVRVDPDFRRPLDPERSKPGEWTAFADGFPLLAASEESLADLGRRAGRTFEVERFRPNIVVRGGAPWAEDSWRSLRSGALTLRAVKPCSRCAITTVDPKTAETGPEPLRTLAAFRRDDQGRVLFGVNLVPEGPARLSVGDTLEAA